MTEVFLSYSRKNERFVRELHEALEKAGRSVWVDWKGIAPTEEWLAKIRTEIDKAYAFLFVISPESASSEVCRIELEHAVAQRKRLIPILHRDAQQVPEALSELNYIFAPDSIAVSQAVTQIVIALDTDLDWLHAHTRLLVKATEWDRENREASYMVRGRDLRDFEDWLGRSPDMEPKPTQLQSQYVLASRRSAVRRLQLIWSSVVVAIGIAAVLATVAYFQSREKVRQQAIAGARQLVTKADAHRETLVDGLASRIGLMHGIRYATRALDTLEGFDAGSFQADQAVRKSFAMLPRWIDIDMGSRSIDASGFDANGAHLALFLGREELQLWDTVGRVQVASCTQHQTAMKSVIAVAAASDGEHVATASYNASSGSGDTKISIWSMSTCEERLSFQTATQENDIAFAAKGSYLVAGARSNVQVWNVEEQHEQSVEFTQRVLNVEPHPDKDWIATLERESGQREYWIRVYRIGTSQMLGEWAVASRPKTIRWLRDSIVVSDHEKTLQFDISSDEPLRELPVIGRFSLSSDGTKIALSPSEDILEIRDMVDFGVLRRTSHEGKIKKFSFDPRGQSLVTVDAGKRRIRFWNFWDEGDSFVLPANVETTAIGFTADSSHLRTSSAEGSVLWGLPEPGKLPSWDALIDSTNPGQVRRFDVDLSPQENLDVVVLKSVDGSNVTRIVEVGPARMATVVSNSGDQIAILRATGSTRGGSERRLEVWDSVGRTVLATRHLDTILVEQQARYLQFTAMDNYIAVRNSLGLEVMLAETLETIAHVTHPGAVSTAVSQNGQILATLGNAGELRIWDSTLGYELTRVDAPDDLADFVLSNDRRWLAALEKQGVVRMWALASADLIEHACSWVDFPCPYEPPSLRGTEN